MKRVWIFLGVIAVMAFTYSCSELEPTPQFPESNETFTVTSSGNSVAVSAADSLKSAISFNWNDPKYVVGLERSKFTIKVASSGSNFVSFQSKEYTGVLTGFLTGKEMNGMALKLGGVIGQAKALDVEVVASHTNNNEAKQSNIIQINVTPYGDLALDPPAKSVTCSAVNASQNAITFTWTKAFNGFNGVKTYQLQYAAGGSNFTSATTIDVSGFSKSFTQFELNKIALANGVSAGAAGVVDFRIKATNELGAVIYSNTSSITVTSYVAYNSIGIIGDATAGAWLVDTDMYRPDPAKPTEWTVVVYLIGGKGAKFRADDDWANNWGAAAFPSGIGVQNGASIPVSTSGYYRVNFNVATGAYSFTAVTTTAYTSISLIGGQTNWLSDIADLTVDPNNNQIWTGIVTLTAGEFKFRANHDWATNWGIASGALVTSFSGYGTQNASTNMSIAVDGTYFVYINVASGEYFLGKSDRNVPYADIGVIGDATAGGWGSDTNLIQNPTNPFKWSGSITLTDGSAKFRADNGWTVNWGNTAFPNGIGTQGGPDIPVTAGTYVITLNTSTGEYTFVK